MKKRNWYINTLNWIIVRIARGYHVQKNRPSKKAEKELLERVSDYTTMEE